MKQLEDIELDRLLSAVIAEQNQRGKKLAVSHEGSRKRRIKSCSLAMFAGIRRASSFVKQLCSRTTTRSNQESIQLRPTA